MIVSFRNEYVRLINMIEKLNINLVDYFPNVINCRILIMLKNITNTIQIIFKNE